MVAEDRMRQLLAAEREDAQRLIASLSNGIDERSAAREGDTTDDGHAPERATPSFERSQAATLLDQSRARLQDIADAVTRLDNGECGICVDCGTPIAEARLEIRPYAARCVDCAAPA